MVAEALHEMRVDQGLCVDRSCLDAACAVQEFVSDALRHRGCELVHVFDGAALLDGKLQLRGRDVVSVDIGLKRAVNLDESALDAL